MLVTGDVVGGKVGQPSFFFRKPKGDSVLASGMDLKKL